ncbi:glycosyltransferase [Roseibium sp.]|uniref:glycosyltransferase n=1 Tax=Roseibium sp. TaxID=1936156 RepID=UPI003B5058DB
MTNKILGNIDALDNGLLTGWVWETGQGEEPSDILIYLDGTEIGKTTANKYRQDLKESNIGNGCHAFEFSSHILFGAELAGKIIDIGVERNGVKIATSLNFVITANASRDRLTEKDIRGKIEAINGDTLSGWIWEPDRLGDASHLAIYLDERKIGIATANKYREDLEKQNIGTGRHAFEYKSELFLSPENFGSNVSLNVLNGEEEFFSGLTFQVPKIKNIRGAIDLASYPKIMGWACNFSDLDIKQRIWLYLNDSLLGEVISDRFRSDLKIKSIGNGYHAFEYTINQPIDPSKSYFIKAEIANTGVELENSPRILEFGFDKNEFHQKIIVNDHNDSGEPTNKCIEILRNKKINIEKTSVDQITSHSRIKRSSVIIPVYNAFDEFVSCLTSVIKHTPTDVDIIISDDASEDHRIIEFAKEVLEKYTNVKLFVNEENTGYTKNINNAIRKCDGDFILLNSDTVVGPNWYVNLSFTAYLHNRIGTVTAISNNAGEFSVPHAGYNQIPDSISTHEMSRLISITSGNITPTVSSGNGFCIYIKRDYYERFGPFDENAFPVGYGEENDICFKGLYAGWQHIVDDKTYVKHVRSASFGTRREDLAKDGRRVLDQKYPEYTTLIGKQVMSRQMFEVRQNVMRLMNEIGENRHITKELSPLTRPRILFVLHHGAGGGTPATNKDLMAAIQQNYMPFLLECDGSKVFLSCMIGTKLHRLKSIAMTTPIDILDIGHVEYERIIAAVIIEYSIELVHVRQFYKNNLAIVEVLNGLKIPTIVSFHDYYIICPNINLVDASGKYCGGICSSNSTQLSNQDCKIPNGNIKFDQLMLRGQWIYEWRQRVEKALDKVDHFITTSESAKDLIIQHYPSLMDRDFSVIPHGRDFESQATLGIPPQVGKKIKILVPGHISEHKGAHFISKLKELDTDNRIEFYFMGNMPQQYRRLGTALGPYERESFALKARQAECNFVGIFSIWPETFCHTLSEAWACGIPVLGSNLGAVAERIKKHGGGWIVDVSDASAALDSILSIAENQQEYMDKKSQCRVNNTDSINTMALEYLKIYKEYIS